MIYELPQVVRDLRDLIGEEAALALVEEAGGTGLYVPKLIEPGHRLEGVVGAQAARQLARVYGGGWLKLPKCDARMRAIRDAEIRGRKAAGASINELARAYCMTARHISRIVADDEREDPRQGNLF